MGIRALLEGDLLENIESFSDDDRMLIKKLVEQSVSFAQNQLTLLNLQTEQQIQQLSGMGQPMMPQQGQPMTAPEQVPVEGQHQEEAAPINQLALLQALQNRQ